MRQAGRSLPEYRSGPRARHAPRDHPGPCAVRRGDAPAGPPARRGRGDPVRRHHHPARRAGRRVRDPGGRRPGHRAAGAHGGRRGRPSGRSSPTRRSAPLLEAIRLIRARVAGAAHRLRRRPVHPRLLPRRGRPVAGLRPDQAPHARRARDLGALMDRLVDATIAYLAAQVAAGAEAVQVFDSWVGGLSPAGLRAPRRGRGCAGCSTGSRRSASRRSISASGTAGILGLQAAAGGDVIGLDWRIALADGRRLVGDRAVQGNLDPALLLGPWEGDRGGGPLDPRPGRRAARPHLQPRPRRPAGDRPRRPRPLVDLVHEPRSAPDDHAMPSC